MILFLLALGCRSAPEPTGEPVFVRDGVVVPAVLDVGQVVGGDRTLVSTDWTPGEDTSIEGFRGTAPLRPECIPLFHVPLSDVSRLAATGGIAPNSSISFSPDGTHLAIGSHQGDLVVVDGWTGEEVSRTVLPEALVKQVAWSPDGKTLYVGEQSPDGFLHAYDPESLQRRWSFRAADFVESSPLPEGEDRYGIFDLPGIYAIRVLANADILVVAVHGWNVATGSRKNRSQVFRIQPDGTIVDRWPDEAISALFLHTVVRQQGDGTERLLLNTQRSADGPAPAALAEDGIALLSLAPLALQSTTTVEPLAPWYKQIYLWQAMDMDAEHGLFLGMSDGRVVFKDAAAPHSARQTVGAATPIMAGKVPIAASVGFGRFVGETVMYTTSDTNIPWGAAVPELRPPSMHPGANGVWVTDPNGTPLWGWQGDMRIQGLSISPDERRGVIGGGHRADSTDAITYGAVVFDLTTPTDGRQGTERRVTTCATANPVYFEHQVLNDGRIAVVEFPIADGQGGVKGAYRATVLR